MTRKPDKRKVSKAEKKDVSRTPKDKQYRPDDPKSKYRTKEF